MQLQIVSTSGFRLEETVVKVIAEAQDGSFCLLPAHRDLATSLVPGLLEFETTVGRTRFAAVDEGLLVKSDSVVHICTLHAVVGDDLSTLEEIVRNEFTELDDRERATRSAVARLEADFAHRFLALREHDHV
jgi:F-type H+-transporting ATPase subunit epsilon